MKKIPKKELDKVVELSRSYWESGGDTHILQSRIAIAKEIEAQTGIDWLTIIDFVDSIVKTSGLFKDASNEMIYILLRVLGWEVVDE